MTEFGYARVSTAKAKGRKAQHVDNQVQRLLADGVEERHIFVDEGVSGRKASRANWDKLLMVLREGDLLIITKLDRIGRSLVNLVDVVTMLGKRGVNIRCLDQGEIDTTSPNGKLLFGIMSLLAEWEADMTLERTLEGLEAARVRHGGVLPTRGPAISEDQVSTAKLLLKTMSAARVADVIGVSRATLYRHVDVAAIRGEAA